MRAIPDIAVDFVAEHEGCKLKAYQDSVGVWTIGFGHTGFEVKSGLTITQAKAREYLRNDLGIAAGRLANKVKPEVIAELSSHQYAALLSFVFNVGAGNWTIWKVLNASRFDQVPAQLMRFVNGGGKKIAGLVNRRTAEVALWSTCEPGTVQETPPSSETRRMDTPPTTVEVKPLAQSKTIWTGAASAAGAASIGVAQIQQLAAPQAQNSELIAKLVGLAAVVMIGLGIAVMVFRWLDQKRAQQ